MLVLKCSSLPDTYFVAYSFFWQSLSHHKFCARQHKIPSPRRSYTAGCRHRLIGDLFVQKHRCWGMKNTCKFEVQFQMTQGLRQRESDNWWYSNAMRRTNSIDVGKHFPIKTSTMTSPAPMVAALSGEDWWPWFDGILFSLSLSGFLSHSSSTTAITSVSSPLASTMHRVIVDDFTGDPNTAASMIREFRFLLFNLLYCLIMRWCSKKYFKL